MAFEGQQILIPGVVAAANYTAVGNQYLLVYLSAKGVVTVCSGDITQHAVGVLQNRPNTGETADVCIFGLTKIQGDTNLAVGNYIAPSLDGQAQVAVTSQYPCGQVVEDNTTGDGYATAFICCAGATVVA